MATVVEVLAKLKADTGQFQKEMGGALGKLQGASQSMAKVGGSLTRSVTLPLVGIGTAAVFTATQFESSMSKIVGLVGIAADEVEGMKSSVLELAGETAKAPQELADALFVVTSAGLRGEDAMGALDSAARASAAGLGETADIARALAGAMNAYGAETLDAAQATDIIVATARAGNFETSQFAGAIGRVLPFAKQAQASFADMGGAVALLTRTNGDAAQSVTQMAALFRSFVVPTRQTTKILGEVGLSAQELRDSIGERGLVPTLQMLDEALDGNREKLGRVLGSSEAAAAAFQILDADAQTVADTFGAVNDAAGITDEAFAAAAETTGFKLQRAMTNFKTVLIEIGDLLAPMVQAVADFATRMASAFRDLPDGVKQLVVVFGTVAAAIGPVLLIAGKLGMAVASLLKLFGGGAGLIGILGALTGPVGIVIAAVAGLVAIFVAMWRESEVFRDAVKNAFEMVRDAVSSAVGTIRGALEDNSDAIEMLRGAFKALGDFVGRVIVPLWANYLSVAIRVVVTLIGGWIRWMGLLLRAFRVALPYVLNFFAEVISGSGRMVDLVLGGIENLIAGLAAALGWIPGIGDSLRSARDGIASFRASVKDNMDMVSDAMRGAADATEASAQSSATSLDIYQDAAVRARGRTEEYRDAAVRARDATDGMTSSTDLLASVTDAAAAATEALSAAYAGLSAFLSESAAIDRAHKLLQDFEKQVGSNSAGFDGFSEAAMANRDAFRQWADSQITAAQSLTEPGERMEALKEIQAKAAEALERQGFDPASSEFYQNITELVELAEQEVEGLGDAVAKAEKSGLDVAAAIAEGIKRGMSAQASVINAAGAVGGDELADGLEGALGISSPSRVAMAAGRNTGLGLVRGLTDFDLSIRNGGNLAGQALIDGMIVGLDSRSGALYSRVRAIVAAALSAANAAARGGGSAPPPPPPTGGAASGAGAATTRARPTSITVNVQAAPGEAASSSVPRALRRAAWVSGLSG